VGYSLSAFKEIFSNHQVCQVKSSGGNLGGGRGGGAGGPGQTHTSHLWSSLRQTVPLLLYSSSCLVIKFFYLGEYKVGSGAAVYAARKINNNYLITCSEVLKKKIWANFQRIIELFAQKIFTKLSKVWVWDPGSGKKPIPDPGSRGQKGTGSRIRIRNTDYLLLIWRGT
jgi:hypothetical protein